MNVRKTGYRHLTIVGFTVDAMQPLALFKDEAAETTFALWLEMADVLTITADLLTSRISARGDRTELLDSVLGVLDLRLTDILINGTAGNGYVADVCLAGNERTVTVRVDLATALMTAIKYKISVGISEEALASSSVVDQREAGAAEPMDDNRLLEMLARMKPEEMGKYPM